MSARASVESSKMMLYVVVVFVVLFLGAAVLGIVMFINNSQLIKDAQKAQDDLKQVGTGSEINEAKRLLAGSDAGQGTTVMSVLLGDMRYLAGVIGGQDLANIPLVGGRVLVEKRLASIWPTLKDVLSSPEEASPSMGLAAIVEALVKEMQEVAQSYAQKQQELDNQKQLSTQTETTLRSQIEEIKKSLGQTSQAAQTYKEAYDKLAANQSKDYERIISDYKGQIDKLQAEKEQQQKDVAQLNQNIGQHETKIKELEGIIQLVRPTPEMEGAALEPDGHVVSVAPKEMLAYINLGNRDHIYRGLTFGVYDSYEAIPKSGQSKGTLEVTEIMDNIAKCRIVEYNPTNPLMKKDIIANLIWSKDKQYQFCVAGEFDFDGDGKIDADGRDRIVGLITAWGGKVTDSVSVETDFLVLGQPPQASKEITGGVMGAAGSEIVSEETQKKQEAVKSYEAIRAEGASLGVPTFNRDRFLRFIGYTQMAKGLH